MEKLKLLFITKDRSTYVERSSFYLLRELAKLTCLQTWSENGDIREILKQLEETPDFILLNDFKPDYCPFIRSLRHSPVPYGAIMHDLHYKIKQRKRVIKTECIRYLFSIYRDPFYRYYPEFTDRMIWLPHHVPTDIFKDYGYDRSVDWLMMGAVFPHIYPLRQHMYQKLKDMKGFTYIPHPGYRRVRTDEPDVFVGEAYAHLINKAKMFFTCDSVEHFPVLKYFEVPACNTLLLASGSGELRDLGFIDGETFIGVNEDNFMEKARYYLNNEEERKAISLRGMKLIKQRHSTEQRAKELVKWIETILKNGDVGHK